MNWVLLLLAGACEVVWAFGLKKYGLRLTLPGIATVVIVALSFILLERAMRTLPLGTAYAIWTGIGAVGAAVIGISVFNESADWRRLICIGLIVAGIAGLKVLTPTGV